MTSDLEPRFVAAALRKAAEFLEIHGHRGHGVDPHAGIDVVEALRMACGGGKNYEVEIPHYSVRIYMAAFIDVALAYGWSFTKADADPRVIDVLRELAAAQL